jgi:uncharacterized membrane protein YdbT with pleckstrin-like domain
LIVLNDDTAMPAVELAETTKLSGSPTMVFAILGAALVLLLLLFYWRYSQVRATLDRRDRIGAFVFFVVVGIPVLTVSVLLTARAFAA